VQPLFRVCNEAFARVADVMQPSLVVAIGGFAEKRAREALGDRVRVGRILHPSPASPAANNWAAVVDDQLRALGFEPA